MELWLRRGRPDVVSVVQASDPIDARGTWRVIRHACVCNRVTGVNRVTHLGSRSASPRCTLNVGNNTACQIARRRTHYVQHLTCSKDMPHISDISHAPCCSTSTPSPTRHLSRVFIALSVAWSPSPIPADITPHLTDYIATIKSAHLHVCPQLCNTEKTWRRRAVKLKSCMA